MSADIPLVVSFYAVFTAMLTLYSWRNAKEADESGDTDDRRVFAWLTLLSPLWPLWFAAAAVVLPFWVLYGLFKGGQKAFRYIRTLARWAAPE